MKKIFFSCFLMIFFGMCSVQAQTKIEVSSNAMNNNTISLNGSWNFIPAKKNYKPKNSTPKGLDEKAAEINSESNTDRWFDIKTPQFLNHIAWWLPNVSEEYEKQETKRIKAFPFDAEKLQAGWYNKTIQLPKNFSSKKTEVYVNFEGVATISRVYCNGHHVGEHLGMFGAFSCRLTPYLKAGENHLLVYVQRGSVAEKGNEVVSVAVSVPVTQDMLSSLNSGMFGGFGNGPRAKFMGIWQSVNLKISNTGGKINDVFFNPTLHGHHLRIEIENPEKNEVSGYVSYTVKDKKTGKLLTSGKDHTILSVDKGGNKLIQIDKQGLNPKLWTPDDPNLYQLEVAWNAENGKVIDRYSCEVGYRTVAVKGKNVMLNGKPYWVRGADMPPYGYKPNDEKTARAFLQLMHDGNTVVTRSHGNPWNHMWYTAADEIGIGVSSEGVRPWALMTTAPAPPKPILEQWKTEQLESIKEYRNHPSILFYELSNEGLQGDEENPKKLAIFKDLIDAVRKMDPSRPIFQTSGDPDVNNQADIEDVHSYWGWYESSSFINDYTKPKRGLTLNNGRPFVNEECAVPYSMIDNGAVHPSYVGRYAAQSWVGDIGTYGSDHSYFQNHIYKEGKVKAEKLRRSRKYVDNSGFMLFSNVTWIQNALSQPLKNWKPFPVYNGVKEGFQPVLVALRSTQRHFFENDTLASSIFVVNDGTHFKDLKNTSVTAEFVNSKNQVVAQHKFEFGKVPYYKVEEKDWSVAIPSIKKKKENFKLRLKLYNAKNEVVSVNNYNIKLYKKIEKQLNKNLISLGNNKGVNQFLKSIGKVQADLSARSRADEIILGPKAKNVDEKELQKHLKKGGRILVLEQKRDANRFIKEILVTDTDKPASKSKSKNNDSYMFKDSNDFKNSLVEGKGEFVEMLGWKKHPVIFKNLEAMDWKWWALENTNKAYASSAAHRIDLNNKNVVPLGRYLKSHFYWHGNLKEVYKKKIAFPVFALSKKYGDLIICELNIDEAINKDPRAAITLYNLLSAPIPNK